MPMFANSCCISPQPYSDGSGSYNSIGEGITSNALLGRPYAGTMTGALNPYCSYDVPELGGIEDTFFFLSSLLSRGLV